VSAALAPTLREQRDALRRELQAHRAVIAQQLGGVSGLGRAFPRSYTMRVLCQRPLQVLRVGIGLIALLRRR
jgi:hypothetical protein